MPIVPFIQASEGSLLLLRTGAKRRALQLSKTTLNSLRDARGPYLAYAVTSRVLRRGGDEFPRSGLNRLILTYF